MLDGETVVEYSAVAETNISSGLNATSSLKPAIHMTKMDTTFAQSVGSVGSIRSTTSHRLAWLSGMFASWGLRLTSFSPLTLNLKS